MVVEYRDTFVCTAFLAFLADAPHLLALLVNILAAAAFDVRRSYTIIYLFEREETSTKKVVTKIVTPITWSCALILVGWIQ